MTCICRYTFISIHMRKFNSTGINTKIENHQSDEESLMQRHTKGNRKVVLNYKLF